MVTRIPVEKLSEGLLKKSCSRNYTHFSADQSVRARTEYDLDEYDAAIGLYHDFSGDSDHRVLICSKGLLIVDSNSKKFLEFEKMSNIPYHANKFSVECLDGSVVTVSVAGSDASTFFEFMNKILFWCKKKRERESK